MVRNGKTSSYAQRWRCKPCGKTVTDSQSSHGGHRHGAPGGTPDAERQRRSRAVNRILRNIKRQQQKDNLEND